MASFLNKSITLKCILHRPPFDRRCVEVKIVDQPSVSLNTALYTHKSKLHLFTTPDLKNLTNSTQSYNKIILS